MVEKSKLLATSKYGDTISRLQLAVAKTEQKNALENARDKAARSKREIARDEISDALIAAKIEPSLENIMTVYAAYNLSQSEDGVAAVFGSDSW
jgi:hypothetical protein